MTTTACTTGKSRLEMLARSSRPNAGDGKHLLDDDAACENFRHGDSQKRNGGNEGVAEHMAH